MQTHQTDCKMAQIDLSETMTKHFYALKTALLVATGLYLPTPGQPLRIRCDVSHYAVGGPLGMVSGILLLFSVATSKGSVQAWGIVSGIRGSTPGPLERKRPIQLWRVC